ncbi:MAG TPA: TIGR02391 family protein [Desulfatiglandales bacterium]|nr:TIGR02391 family protein [Desulfatiglandales bacterium]
MAHSLLELSADEVQSLPIDRLGILVLKYLVDTKEWNAYNFLNSGRNLNLPEPTLRCWSEALNWLFSKNLVARGTPGQSSSDAIFVTRLGSKVLEVGLETIRACERLDVELHHRLEQVKSQFLLGQFELADFAAMREVEIRVRELSGADSSLLGVKLMRNSFGEGGKLADPKLDPGERVGIMELFAGAIGTFKNPPSHRQVDYADPTEASEVVLLADLLMRLLDRVGARIAEPTNTQKHES